MTSRSPRQVRKELLWAKPRGCKRLNKPFGPGVVLIEVIPRRVCGMMSLLRRKFAADWYGTVKSGGFANVAGGDGYQLMAACKRLWRRRPNFPRRYQFTQFTRRCFGIVRRQCGMGCPRVSNGYYRSFEGFFP